jgi:hypothetical protein
MFTNNHYSGGNQAHTRSSYTRAPTIRRTSNNRRVTYRTPSPNTRTRRKSKERTPRSKIFKYLNKGIIRMSPSRFKNQYARDVGEFMQALSPLIISIMSLYAYKTVTGPTTTAN